MNRTPSRIGGTSPTPAITTTGSGLQRGTYNTSTGPIEVVEPIIPFNLGVGQSLLDASSSDTASGAFKLSSDELLRLQMDTICYLDNLDAILRGLHARDNDKLRQRMKDTADVPLTFMYFRLQEKMMQLGGELSIDAERKLLGNLAELLGS